MGALFKNPVHIYMPDWVSKERVDLMKMFNAKVTLISKEEGGFKHAIEEASDYAERNNAFLSNQFENENNILAHYETTGKEIVEKLGKDIGGFVSGIGTGGTLMGVGKRLKEENNNIKIYAFLFIIMATSLKIKIELSQNLIIIIKEGYKWNLEKILLQIVVLQVL